MGVCCTYVIILVCHFFKSFFSFNGYFKRNVYHYHGITLIMFDAMFCLEIIFVWEAPTIKRIKNFILILCFIWLDEEKLIALNMSL